MKRKVDLKMLAEAVLWKLYQHGTEVGGPLPPGKISELFKVSVTSTLMKEALAQLETAAVINRLLHMSQTAFEINAKGIEHVQNGIKDDSSLIHQLSTNRDEWLDGEKEELRMDGLIKEAEGHILRKEKNTIFGFKKYLLLALWRKDKATPDNSWDLRGIADEAGLKYQKGWIQKVAEWLRDEGLIKLEMYLVGDSDGGCQADITAAGIAAAENLAEALGKNESAGEKLETDADKWEPLPIERESVEYKEAVISLEETIDVVKADNGYAATYPEERNSILWTLGTGVNALREGLVTKQQVEILLLNPLKYLVKKFADAIMGESAKTTLAKVIAWLGWGG